MRILLDECVPWPLHTLLPSNQCTSVTRRGWGGIGNGVLISRAEAEFDLFITSDQNLRYQQNLAGRGIAILELSTNDLHSIVAAKDRIRTAVDRIAPGEFQPLEIPPIPRH